MKENKKLIIGEPYEIVVRENGRIIKIRGNKLTQDDVDEFIEDGIITKDDIEAPKKFEFPDFSLIVKSINDKFPGWFGFMKKLYKTYPPAAFSILLKEYSAAAMKDIVVKPGDKVYLVSLIDITPCEYVIPKDDTNLDTLKNVSVFPNLALAHLASLSILAGLSEYDKP